VTWLAFGAGVAAGIALMVLYAFSVAFLTLIKETKRLTQNGGDPNGS
jgi:hypothetical protein